METVHGPLKMVRYCSDSIKPLLLCRQVLQRGGEHDRGGLLPAHALHLHPHQQEEGEDARQGQQEVQGEGDKENID